MDEPGNGKPPEDEAADGTSGDRTAHEPTPPEPEPPRDTVDRLIGLVGPRLDDARALLEEGTARWRGDAVRISEGTRQRLRDLFRELGLVTRDDWDELELRVAQLEHRLRLLEEREDETSWPTSG
jgi:polyhydroxyalkanoate synthesis regulator phasin